MGVTESWLGPKPANGVGLDGEEADHLDHYQHDFKRHRRCENCQV
jgi:hypothetical protein